MDEEDDGQALVPPLHQRRHHLNPLPRIARRHHRSTVVMAENEAHPINDVQADSTSPNACASNSFTRFEGPARAFVLPAAAPKPQPVDPKRPVKHRPLHLTLACVTRLPVSKTAGCNASGTTALFHSSRCPKGQSPTAPRRSENLCMRLNASCSVNPSPVAARSFSLVPMEHRVNSVLHATGCHTHGYRTLKSRSCIDRAQ